MRATAASAWLFAAKASVLRFRRGLRNLVGGPPRLRRAAPGAGPAAGLSRTPLRSELGQAERVLELGKIQNLRVACRMLDRLVIPAGTVFSLWRHLGPPTARRGFVPGRMLQQGCMVPAIGGGLCQLSNALYDAALQSGCDIVERHAHSRVVPGSAAAAGRDATIAWNYVDLRFAPRTTLHLSARMDRDSLVVALHGAAGATASPATAAQLRATARSCASCGEAGCVRHELPRDTEGEVVAFLVDEAWPEFVDHVRAVCRPEDFLGRPLDGFRFGLSRYAWPVAGLARHSSAPLATLRRTVALRRAGPQGARRRRAELAGTRRIALALARLIPPESAAVTVAQSFLPFLWQAGVLGGRHVSVLMTRLPAGVLQARLDRAAAAHPDRATLTDYRAEPWLVQAEADALAAADRIITPHTEVAALFGPRATLLAWRMPPRRDAAPGNRVVFPGPTIARKGAYAVRAAARALDVTVVAMGGQLEGASFWAGTATSSHSGWDGAAVAVQPALVEDQPRRLLAALAAGVPVIASAACGLPAQPGLTIVPADDAAALTALLRDRLAAGGVMAPGQRPSPVHARSGPG